MTNTSTSTSLLAKTKAVAFSCEFCEKTGLAILPVRAALMHPNAGAPLLPDVLYPIDGQGGKRLSLEGTAAAATLGPQPAALLVIDDPTGIAAEIGARAMEVRREFMALDDRSRKAAVSTAILGLQVAVSDRSEINEIAAGDEFERDSHLVPDGIGRVRYVANPARLAATTAADLDRTAAQSWTNYARDYDEGARSRWQKQFDKEYGQFTDETLWPLATSHVTWMTSNQMRDHLDCNYDSTSAEVGLVYTRVLEACIQGTEQFEPCAQLYAQWLGGVMSDDKNIVLRGIVLNLKNTRKDLAQSLTPNVTWESIGWDGLFGAFNNAIDGVEKQAHDELTRLLTSLGGSIARILQSTVDGPVRHGLVALGVVSGRTVAPVSLTGSYKAYRASLIRQLLKTSGVKKIGENAMQREVSLALRRLQLRGEPMKATVSSTFLVMIDEEMIKAMPEGLKKSEQAKWLAGAIRSADQIDKLNLSAWRERIDIPGLNAKAVKAAPLIGNVVAGLFQWAAYQKVSQDLAGSMSHEKREIQDRLASAVLAMGATVADSIARATAHLADTPLTKGWAASLGTIKHFMGRASKGMGIVAAGIGAYWDVKNAADAYQQENLALSVAKGFSAFFGVVSAVLVAVGSVIGAIVTTLAFIGAGVIATFLEDDKIDKWLKRCYWGVLDVKDRYQNSEAEMSGLKIATGG